MKPDAGIIKRNICNRTSGDHCTGIDVNYGICNEPYFEVQSFRSDSLRIVL